MRSENQINLEKLRKLRAMRERLALAERVMARSIADKAIAAVAILRNEIEDTAYEMRRSNDADFSALQVHQDLRVNRIVSVFDAAQGRADSLRNLQSTLLGAEDAAKAHGAEAERIALIHNQIRARVGGLDRLVSELQANERRRVDVSQDEATEVEMIGAFGTTLGGEIVSNDTSKPNLGRAVSRAESAGP
jgi:hypothetical protein